MTNSLANQVRFQRHDNDIFIFIAADAEAVTPDQLKQALQMSEFASARLIASDILATVASNFRGWQQREHGNEAHYSEEIATVVDAEVTITIEEGDMSATAEVTAAYGGEPITRSKLLDKLRSCGISSGIQRTGIDQILMHCLEAPAGSTIDVVIARGKPPKNGRSARFEQLVPDARERVLKPQEREDGTVDMRDLGKQITVNVGDQLMRRLPPESGTEGFTVKGTVIGAEAGDEYELAEGEGSAIADYDPDLLIATKVGMPWFTKNSANIDDVLTMKAVDVSTGHVDFQGSVIVSGNVTEGMRVVATGDITVAGYVDSAELKAGGNITVRKGCIGHMSKEDEEEVVDNDHFIPTLSCTLIADGTIYCAYAQYARLEAKHGIKVDKQLTHCHVITEGQGDIGGDDAQARGKIIGGRFETCAPVFAGQLGARAGTRTRFFLSPPPPDDATLESISSVSKGLKAAVAQLRRLLTGLERCNAFQDAEQRAQHTKTLSNAIKAQQQVVQSYRDDLAILRASIDTHPTLKVIAAKEVFPGVQFLHEQKKLQMKEHRGGTLFMLQDHQLRMDILR